MDPRVDFDVDEHKILLPHVICVEGNIGSGKSTLLQNLENEGYRVIPEPVKHIWGQYLPRLYENLERWGCSFQMEVIDWFRQLQATHLHQEIKQTCKDKQLMMKKHNKNNKNNIKKDNLNINKLKNKNTNCATNSVNNNNNNNSNIEEDTNDNKSDSSKNMIDNINNNDFKQSDEDNNNNCNHNDYNSDTPESENSKLVRDISMFELTDNVKKSFNIDTCNGNSNGQDSSENIENIDPNDPSNNNNIKDNKQVFIIVERSALSAYKIFSGNLYESGKLTEWEYSLLKRWYSLVMWQPKYVLYLRCNPDISIKRIHQRNRNGENKVDPNLINILHNKHENMFVKNYGKNMNTFKINQNNFTPTKYNNINNNNNNNNIRNNNKPSIIYVNGNNNANQVLNEALLKISKLPIPQKIMCNVCRDCGTPRVQPRILSPISPITNLHSFNLSSKSHSHSKSKSKSKSHLKSKTSSFTNAKTKRGERVVLEEETNSMTENVNKKRGLPKLDLARTLLNDINKTNLNN